LTIFFLYDIKIFEYYNMKKNQNDILDYREVSNFLKALSHPTRLMIVMKLLEGEGKRCVNDITELVKVSQPNISQHLAILKASGLVGWNQEGKKKCYFLKNHRLIKSIVKKFEKSRINEPAELLKN